MLNLMMLCSLRGFSRRRFAFLGCRWAGVALSLLLAGAAPVLAQSNGPLLGIPFQGFLTDNNGTPIDGEVEVTFALQRPGDDTPLRQYTRMVSVQDGLLTALIEPQPSEDGFPGAQFYPSDTFFPGEMMSPGDPDDAFFPGEMMSPSQLDLVVTVGGEEVSATRLEGVPFALSAAHLYNNENLLAVSKANIGVLVDNDESGAGQFGVFVGQQDVPALRVADVGDEALQTDIQGNVVIEGNLTVNGTLTENGGASTSRIRQAASPGTVTLAHPTQAGETLRHATLAGPEPLSVYTGTVRLNADGTAAVKLPAWFEALHDAVRYALTPIGAAMPNLHVARPVGSGQFRIGGGAPGGEVSWQLTARRTAAATVE
jgi:hypothetical protein